MPQQGARVRLLPSRRRVGGMLLGGLLLVAAISACGRPAPSTDGPLGAGGDGGRLCMPDPTSVAMTDSLTAFTNPGSLPLTIDRVWLRNPKHLRIVDASIVLVGTRGMPEGFAYPPPAHLIPAGVDWAGRKSPNGAIIRPKNSNPADATYNIVLALQPDKGMTGTADGVNVAYHDSNGSYVMPGKVAREVTTKATCGDPG
jgi:hypothetical protein